jgi:murein hydrolase activator
MANRSFEVIGVSAASALIVVASAQTPDRARAEALARRAGERLVALQREADRLASEESTLLNQLRKLEVERQIRAEELKRADADVERAQQELDAIIERVTELQASETAEKPQLRTRLIEMYKLGQARYARMLLSASDLRRMGQVSRTVAALAKLDRDRILVHQRTVGDLKTAREAAEERRRQAAALRDAVATAQIAAARAARAQADLIRDVDRRRDLNAQLESELHATQQKLQLTLRENATAPEPMSLPLRPFEGDLNWPVDSHNNVRRLTGRTRLGRGASTTTGIEVLTDDGAQVVAVHDGVVAFAGTFAGFGNLVILDHGSQAFSLYGDLLTVTATKGARVDRGQRVGTVGPLTSGGTGLYFELRVDGRAVDPLQWLRKTK